MTALTMRTESLPAGWSPISAALFQCNRLRVHYDIPSRAQKDSVAVAVSAWRAEWQR